LAPDAYAALWKDLAVTGEFQCQVALVVPVSSNSAQSSTITTTTRAAADLLDHLLDHFRDSGFFVAAAGGFSHSPTQGSSSSSSSSDSSGSSKSSGKGEGLKLFLSAEGFKRPPQWPTTGPENITPGATMATTQRPVAVGFLCELWLSGRVEGEDGGSLPQDARLLTCRSKCTHPALTADFVQHLNLADVFLLLNV
jgi:hypothetical protein